MTFRGGFIDLYGSPASFKGLGILLKRVIRYTILGMTVKEKGVKMARKFAKPVPQEVMDRLTGNESEEKRELIPGIYTWKRPSKIKCEGCRQYINKGDHEIANGSSGSHWGMSFSHYHVRCFVEKLAKELGNTGNEFTNAIYKEIERRFWSS